MFPRTPRKGFVRKPQHPSKNEEIRAKKRLRLEDDPFDVVFLFPNETSMHIALSQDSFPDLDALITELEERYGKTESSRSPQHRSISWLNAWIEDSQGHKINTVEKFFASKEKKENIFLLQDGHVKTGHIDPELWNVTPEPEMLQRLPHGYTLETALADHVDNALQAVSENKEGDQKLVSVEIAPESITIFDTGLGMNATGENSIKKWGTVGASSHRSVHHKAVDIKPPFLKPYFGKYGVGGVAAALHLGERIEVYSKTKQSNHVVCLILTKALKRNESNGVWKTSGGFRAMTEDEKQKSPHGSFTAVKISMLKRAKMWSIKQVKRMLKDIYSLYIQSDDLGRTVTPVVFEVNGEDLLEEMGGEITTCNKHSSIGAPFIFDVKFYKKNGVNNVLTGDMEKGNARLTCQYLPCIKGREKISEVIEELTSDGLIENSNFDTFPRIRVRWLGRLLPHACWDKMPFMDLKNRNHVQRWIRRVKIFADVDAGFHPNPTKTNLADEHPFTIGLRKLGLKEASPDVNIQILIENKEVSAVELHNQFMMWVKSMHEQFDEDVQFGDEPTFVLKWEGLTSEKDVLTLHKHLIDDSNGDWKAGDKIKISNGVKHKQNFYGIIEWSFHDGPPEAHGEVKVICRPIEIDVLRGGHEESEFNKESLQFKLNRSKCMLACLLTSKCRMSDKEWDAQVNKLKNKDPSFIQILNDQERIHFEEQAFPKSGGTMKAGQQLTGNILLVVRPRQGQGDSWKQGMIVKRNLKMNLEVLHKDATSGTENILKSCTSVGETRKSIQGIYSFSATDACPSLNKAGHYKFIFSLVDAQYQHVKPAVWDLTVTADEKVNRWCVKADEPLTIMLDEVVKHAVYIEKYDMFGNVICFANPICVKLGIVAPNKRTTVTKSVFIQKQCISLSDNKARFIIQNFCVPNCNLDKILPNYHALLSVYDGEDRIGEHIRCFVYPGKLESIKITSCSMELNSNPVFIKRSLMPGDSISISFQGKDKSQNLVTKGSNVILKLDGIEPVECHREMDGSGHLHLSNLKVQGPFNSKGSVSVYSEDDVKMIEVGFRTATRRLCFLNKPPERALIGRTLGVTVNVVDQDGQVDQSIYGQLSVDWEKGVCYILNKGVCDLPKIKMPKSPGDWKGRISFGNLNLCFEIRVEMDEATKLCHCQDVQDVYKVWCAEELILSCQALDDMNLPATLSENAIKHMDVEAIPEDPTLTLETVLKHKDVFCEGSCVRVKAILNGMEGCYEVVLKNDILTNVSWRVRLGHGPVSALHPIYGTMNRCDEVWKCLRDGASVQTVRRRSWFPEFQVALVDSKGNICSERYEGKEVVVCVGETKTQKISGYVKDGFASIPKFYVHLEVGKHQMLVNLIHTGVKELLEFEVIPGNYPSSLRLLDDTCKHLEVILSDNGDPNYIPILNIYIDSEDGCPLTKREQLMLSIMTHTEEKVAGYYPSKQENSEYSFEHVAVPTKAGKYSIKFYIEGNHEVTPLRLQLTVVHASPVQLDLDMEDNICRVQMIDRYGNICLTCPEVEIEGEIISSKGLIKAYNLTLINGEAAFEDFRGLLKPGYYQVKISVISSNFELPILIKRFSALCGEHPRDERLTVQKLVQQDKEYKQILEYMRNVEQKLEQKRTLLPNLERQIVTYEDNLKRIVANLDEQQLIEYNDEEVLQRERDRPDLRTERDIERDLKWFASKGWGPALALWNVQGEKSRNFPSSEILGLVVTLARVETDDLNRTLSDYLGSFKLNAMVCKSEKGANWLEPLDATGCNVDETRGLYSYANKHNLSMKKFQVICLDLITPYKSTKKGEPAVDVKHPQKLLNIPLPYKNVPPGFLGYAVNLLHLTKENLPLRQTLFYELFKELQVYDTRQNMMNAVRRGCEAVSLDGGMRTHLGPCLGKANQTRICFANVPFAERQVCSLVPPLSEVLLRRSNRSLLIDEREKTLGQLQLLSQNQSKFLTEISELESELEACKEKLRGNHTVSRQIIALPDKTYMDEDGGASDNLQICLHPDNQEVEKALSLFIQAEGF